MKKEISIYLDYVRKKLTENKGVKMSVSETNALRPIFFNKMIYFTEGDGVFPEKTDYETAFVFVKKCECMDLIPGWITKLLIYQE